MNLAKLGGKVSKEGLEVTISYGSGGFCVVLMHNLSRSTVAGYSWSLEDAVDHAIEKLNEALKDKTTPDEEDTDPGGDRATNPELFDTSYKIVNKK